jgi:hypothetical protein
LKTQVIEDYLKVFLKECGKGYFWRLEFASKSSGGIMPLKCSKGGGIKVVTYKLSSGAITLYCWPESIEE